MLRVLVVAGALALAGCATGYHKTGMTGGFDDVRLAPDMYRISVQGNAYTSSERAEQIMLLRASELALANGYPKFVVVNREGRSESQLIYTGRYTGYTNVQHPRANMTVRFLSAADPAARTALDAATIEAELRPRFASQ